MKASVDGIPALIGVCSKSPDTNQWTRQAYRKKVKLGKSWKEYSYTFHPKYPYVFVTIGPALEKDQREDVSIDAVQLERGEKATHYQARTPVEFSIEASSEAGIFTRGEAVSLILRVCNDSSSLIKEEIQLEASDFFGAEFTLPPCPITIQPNSSISKTVSIPADWHGYYKVTATLKTASGTRSSEIPLAIVPARTGSDSVLGINHAFNNQFLVRQATKAGVTWYRDWSLKWNHMEPSPGQYRWELADPQIDRIVRKGLNIVALLPPFPSANWNSEAPEGILGKGYPEERLPSAWAPKNPDKLGEFTRIAVERYRDRVKCWEFLNEPIYTSYSLPGKEKGLHDKYGGKSYVPADYVNLLSIAAKGMKTSDPACRIIGGIGAGADTLTKELIEAGCLKYLDILNLHIYPGAACPESFIPGMDKLLEIMDANGGRKPIWITEFSYYGTDSPPRKPFFPDADSWSEERRLSGERECAEYTIRFLTIMLSRGVEKIFIHSGSSGAVNDTALECCLFKYGGLPRKIVPALAVFTDMTGPSPKFAGERKIGQSGLCMAFETGRQSLLLLWTDTDELLSIKVPTGTVCSDLMGRNISTDLIPVSRTPIYLSGPAGKAKDVLESLEIH